MKLDKGQKRDMRWLSDICMAAGLGMFLGGILQLGVNSRWITWFISIMLIIGSYIILRKDVAGDGE